MTGMLLARGAVQDRPFGKTIETIALRAVTGQLTVESDGGTYAIVFDRGYIVAANTPQLSDSALAVALANDIVTASQGAVVSRWLDAVPDADAFEVIATVALMTRDEVLRLRRRVIAHRAARVIALEHGDFVLTQTIAIDVFPGCEMHVGGVIYQAARMFVYEGKLKSLVAQMGSRFELKTSAQDELPYYGFGEGERAFLRALVGGVAQENVGNRLAQAMVYALASCGALYCEPVASPTSRFARGTRNPMPKHAADQKTPAVEVEDRRSIELMTEPLTKGNAEEAFQRAQLALQGQRVDDAVFDLELATQLAPNEPRYFAALAWARFCRAPDKAEIASETRRMLNRAIAKAQSQVLPHYYLGMVERMLNRTEAAAEHFREVLELQPNHPEAMTELRFLDRKR